MFLDIDMLLDLIRAHFNQPSPSRDSKAYFELGGAGRLTRRYLVGGLEIFVKLLFYLLLLENVASPLLPPVSPTRLPSCSS